MFIYSHPKTITLFITLFIIPHGYCPGNTTIGLSSDHSSVERVFTMMPGQVEIPISNNNYWCLAEVMAILHFIFMFRLSHLHFKHYRRYRTCRVEFQYIIDQPDNHCVIMS